MTFFEHLQEINACESIEDANKCINENFIDVQYVFYTESYIEGQQNSLKVNDVFFELLEKNYFDDRCLFSLALIELLADFFERYKFVSALIQIEKLVDAGSPLKKRIKASLLFLKVNNATIDYFDRFDEIISYLVEVQEEGERYYKSTITFINFYFTAISSFIRLDRNDLIQEFVYKARNIKDDFIFINESIVDQLFLIPFTNFKEDFNTFYGNISIFIKSKLEKNISKEILLPEQSRYTDDLISLDSKDFASIRQLSVNYIMNLSERTKLELKNRLDNGVKVIDDSDLLYAYFYSFGKMHYSKIYEAITKVTKEIENQSIEIYDWGCGQALASMVFFEFIKQNNINIEITSISLIEPSELALKRGIAHLNFICPENTHIIKPICKDLDSVNDTDLLDSTKIKLHLLSNIIDVPHFDLNLLCKRISSLKGINILICVSPVLTEIGRQVRIPKFFDFFNKNYQTQLFAETFNTKKTKKWKSNNCPCAFHEYHNDDNYICKSAWTRHEIIFSFTKI